jgi:hypothetical protein
VLADLPSHATGTPFCWLAGRFSAASADAPASMTKQAPSAKNTFLNIPSTPTSLLKKTHATTHRSRPETGASIPMPSEKGTDERKNAELDRV